MATATLQRPTHTQATGTQPVRLCERAVMDAGTGPALTIDKEHGVVHGVKVLGLQSTNTHRVPGAKRTIYAKDALAKAVPLYEGVVVRMNHDPRDKPQGGDSNIERNIGVLRNVRLAEDGIRADLHYKKSHPFVPQLIEDIERRMGTLALSHDADGKGPVGKDGTFTVEQILEVRSVDLVTKGGTTANLWESNEGKNMAETRKVTLRRLLKEAFVSGKLNRAQEKAVVSLLEQPYMDEKPMQEDEPLPMGGMEVDAPVDASPDDALKEGFRAALVACIDEALSGGKDPTEALKKIKELLTTHGKLSGNGGSEAKSETSEADEPEKKDEKKDTKESKEPAKDNTEVVRLRNEVAVAKLCESMNFQPSKSQREALVALSNDAARKEFINELQSLTNKPRSGGVHRADLAESKNGKPAAKDAKDFASAITLR